MLDSITIRNIATFDNTGVQITDIRKVNFIYGVNGSGKTTITKYIDNPTDPRYKDCMLQWKDGIPIKTLIYNKDFRTSNFGKAKLDGVFTLGKATKDEIDAIEKMQIDLTEIKNKGIKKKDSLDKVTKLKEQHEDEYKEEFWSDIYKKYETVFKEAFIGVMKKESFKGKIIEEYQTNKNPLKTYEELKKKAVTIFGKMPQPINPISKIDFSRLLEIEKDKIWQKKIIGKADVEIAKLIQKLNLNDWVNEGRGYLQENETCPFCQQETITKDFRKQLGEYFDESFTIDIKLVKKIASEYNELSENLINLLQGIENAQKLDKETKLNIESFSAHNKTLASQFLSNREILNNKIKEPSRSLELISVKDQLEKIEKIISDTNTEIDAHNLIVTNNQTERAGLIKDIWKYITEENKTKIQRFIKKGEGLQKGINTLTIQHKGLQTDWITQNKKIQEANKNVTSVQPSVDEINKMLKSFGFINFEIVPSKTEKNQYQIQREDGTLAEETLSEGEITFITFLYFMQLARGSIKQETITEERILIVDDPISSLDSNILFVISTLLKELIKTIKKGEGNIKQLILLTHNVYFHKEVSFIDGRTTENGDTFFWILRRNNKISIIQHYGMRNPIHTSYELLWHELRNENNSGITIQNIMRRIIECYFKLLGKYADDDLIRKFTNAQDQEICRSLISWINDGSHGMPDDLFIELQDTTIDKYQEVFKSIFIQTGHQEHYQMMMNIPMA